MRWVADIGSNHNGDLKRAVSLIYAAKEIGCTDVKFQLFNGEIGKPEKEWLPLEWLPTLRDYTQRLDLGFGCSPFYFGAVRILKPWVDFYKIASSQVENKKLIKDCAKTRKPLVVSIPVDRQEQVNTVFEWIQGWGIHSQDITVLYCIPKYPAKPEDCNLRGMKTFRLGLWVNNEYLGYSDHTKSPAVLYRVAHRYNAKMIEFHLDLDGQGWEYKHGHCWLPDEIAEVIKTVNEGFKAD